MVSCGTNITSTTVAARLVEKLRARGITRVKTLTVRNQSALEAVRAQKPDLIVFTGHSLDFPCPSFTGTPFLTGIGDDQLVDEIVDVLKKPHWAGKARL